MPVNFNVPAFQIACYQFKSEVISGEDNKSTALSDVQGCGDLVHALKLSPSSSVVCFVWVFFCFVIN